MARLNVDQWRQVEQLFSEVRDAASERGALRQAVGMLEAMAGKQTGTWQDLAGNRAGAGLPGQLDCIAESTNSTRFLQALEHRGLLKWHHVVERRKRTRWVFEIHWTAVIQELDDGHEFAVDSWFYDNGEPAIVVDLRDWLDGADVEAKQPQLPLQQSAASAENLGANARLAH